MLRSSSNFGYAFMNFVSDADARQFKQAFDRFCCWPMASDKVMEID